MSGGSAVGALGERLRARGLSERAVAACFGAGHIIHAPLRAREARALAATTRQPRPIVPPAALLAHLFVGGSTMPEADLRRYLGPDVDLLAELSLVHVMGGAVAAAVTILPVGEALVVSDRADRQHGHDAVALADDSAYHLIDAVPGRGRRSEARWLDVGTGSAIVPLARPGAAHAVLGTDIHPRAVSMATLGAALSGRSAGHGTITVRVADVLAGADEDGPWDLITFNAPIPRAVLDAGPEAPLYRQSEGDLAARFWAEARDLVAGGGLAPGGEVLVHSWQPDEDYPACLGLPGRVVAVRYTPRDEAVAFGVTAWQPDGAPACRLGRVDLDEGTPYVTRALLDRD